MIAKQCGICLGKCCYKNLNNDYFFDGEIENYGDMILKTFNITLKSTHKLICEACITKLRQAKEFKQQVTALKDTLLSVKEEINEKLFDSDLELDSDIEVKSENDINEINGHSFVIKLGSVNNIHRQQSREHFHRRNIQDDHLKDKDDDDDHFDDGDIQDGYKSDEDAKSSPNNLVTIEEVIAQESKLIPEEADLTRKPSNTQINLRENTLKLIIHSNVCLFKSLKTKYACYYCKKTYFNITELREHSQMHFNPDNIKVRLNRLTGLTYSNVDITDLQCRLCASPCSDLNDLKLHLVSHNIDFKDGGHLLIPYRLEKGFQCVLCEKVFFTFTRLSIHMHSHSTNNICEICGISYYTRLSLRNHLNAVHAEKKCTPCNLTFATKFAQTKHLRLTHNLVKTIKRNCLRCEKTFLYGYQLSDHMVEKHGVKRNVFNCQYCERKFKASVYLKIHERNVHIRERNYPCSLCEMRFFTKFDKQRHERTHLDVRAFSCDFCDTKFKAKDSLRRHLKKQHGQT